MSNFQTLNKDFVMTQTELILKSYKHWLGRDLIASEGLSSEQIAEKAFNAPFALLSSTNDQDPILNYGNQTALDLWEMSWETLVQTPGRETAEAMERNKREEFLKRVSEQGYVEDYTGVRISSTGKRFKIKKATVWNLIDEKNNFCGQAATFYEWTYLS